MSPRKPGASPTSAATATASTGTASTGTASTGSSDLLDLTRAPAVPGIWRADGLDGGQVHEVLLVFGAQQIHHEQILRQHLLLGLHPGAPGILLPDGGVHAAVGLFTVVEPAGR